VDAEATLPLSSTNRRRAHARRKSAWVAAYAFGVVLPLVLVAGAPMGDGRGIADELGSALGIVALSLLGLQLVVPARLRVVSGVLGADVAVRLHRRLADVTFAVIGAHVAVVVLAQAAVGSTLALALLVGSSVWRGRLQIPYVLWRGLHIVLGGAALVFATVHTIGVNRYLMHGPAAVWLGVFFTACIVALVELRLLKPRRLARDAYVVKAVVPEAGGATTIKLQAKGHLGKPFRPGQFAWLKLAEDCAGLAEHPFSYSSSAITPARPAFTIKAYDGFSRRVAELTPGTEVVIDGPHGSYWPEREATGYILIAAGIGITPSISLLRTAADLGDERPYLLVYANRSQKDIVMADELDGIAHRLDLTVVHVLSAPAPGWVGERGRICRALLDRHLPADMRGYEFFVCASPQVEATTVEALALAGVAPEFVHVESFEHV
jgi:predicted ferric reductase